MQERESLIGLRDRLFTVRPRPHCIVRTGWPQYSCMNEADAQHSHEAMSYDVRRRWRRPSSSSRMAVARGTASKLDATVEVGSFYYKKKKLCIYVVYNVYVTVCKEIVNWMEFFIVDFLRVMQLWCKNSYPIYRIFTVVFHKTTYIKILIFCYEFSIFNIFDIGRARLTIKYQIE